ncbi:MAG: hypothetical protein E7Z94_07995 [Actinomyces ruminicola]|uniref:FHA domain-containing protein n=1 Tax=Actinomyces ruminicola TaxID=332524 RepID=A0A1G9RXT8_9ACTO|nr:hypothetical protein [Actinomyces ruminicola]MBE6482294.1 hypothetical protein [Actinomyces ruminicola]SDM28041.1 hypothetical protein SAMN04487766_101201 [Actinomyces ruminicola]
MSDLTWTDLPEVDPDRPDELVLDFSGEVYRVGTDETFVIGRGGDLDIDDNPYLHRRFLVLRHDSGLWWIANEGSHLSATLTDGDGLVQSRLAPGASMPLVFSRVILTFSAGPTTYEIDLITADVGRFNGIEGVRDSRGQTTIGATPMTRSQLLLVLALAEPVLKRAGTGAAEIPSSASAAARLGWSLTKFNRKLDNVCEKLDRVGVRGLRGGRSGGVASNRRAALVEHAVSTLMVTAEDLPLLDEEHQASQAAAARAESQIDTAPVPPSSGSGRTGEGE